MGSDQMIRQGTCGKKTLREPLRGKGKKTYLHDVLEPLILLADKVGDWDLHLVKGDVSGGGAPPALGLHPAGRHA